MTKSIHTILALVLTGILMTGCASVKSGKKDDRKDKRQYTEIRTLLELPDHTAFAQKDPRWAEDRLGGTGESLASDGCLVTAAAMALGNLGFKTDPADLNARLKQNDGFTPQGWLVWSGISKVTQGQAEARFFDNVSADIIETCMADGYYPLARFILPSGRSHWAMIVKKSEVGYHMRDPLHPSNKPLIFPRSVDAFKAVRCVGLSDKGKAANVAALASGAIFGQ